MEWEMLSGFSEADRAQVLRRCRRTKYRAGQTLFHEGDPGHSLHLLAKGTVAIRVSTPLGDVTTLTVLGPGMSFGELALVSPSARRSAGAVALEPVETLVLDRGEFDSLRAKDPRFDRLLVLVLAAQVRRLSAQVLVALFASTDRRVVVRLAELVPLFERAGTAGPVVVRVTQEDLASLAGTTRPTTNRVLQSLARDGIVALARGRINVLDRAGLEQLAREM